MSPSIESNDQSSDLSRPRRIGAESPQQVVQIGEEIGEEEQIHWSKQKISND